MTDERTKDGGGGKWKIGQCSVGPETAIILFAGNWCTFDSLFFLHIHIILSEGCESADWAGTYGVTASGSGNTKSLSSFIFCHHYFCPHMYFVIIICVFMSL